jgi:hypothetical protein
MSVCLSFSKELLVCLIDWSFWNELILFMRFLVYNAWIGVSLMEMGKSWRIWSWLPKQACLSTLTVSLIWKTLWHLQELLERG